MIETVLVTVCTVAICFLLHLAILDRLARMIDRSVPVRRPMLVVIFTLFAAHLLEVLIYGLALWLLDWRGHGMLSGAVVSGGGSLLDHLYFSITCYTTLGIGDIIPEGEIRLLAGIEALNGLVLIAWSASFTYLVMERLLRVERARSPGQPKLD